MRLRLALARYRTDAYFAVYRELWHAAIRHGAYEFLSDQRKQPAAGR